VRLCVTIPSTVGLGRPLPGLTGPVWGCDEAIEQRDAADEAKHIGASQLIPGVRQTPVGSRAGVKRVLRIGLLVMGSLPLVVLGGLEVAYRVVIGGIQPAPVIEPGAPVHPRLACALWAAETGGSPRSIPALYPWSVHRYFNREPGLLLAWGVARGWLGEARERGQVRGMWQWHLKGVAATAWVTRNMSTDEIVSRYAELVWAGGSEHGLEPGAQHWYRASAASLGDAQLALLVGLARAPRAYDPQLHPDRALARRNLVLERFVEAGCMAPSSLTAAQAEPVVVNPIS
jgi:hypothetical protein